MPSSNILEVQFNITPLPSPSTTGSSNWRFPSDFPTYVNVGYYPSFSLWPFNGKKRASTQYFQPKFKQIAWCVQISIQKPVCYSLTDSLNHSHKISTHRYRSHANRFLGVRGHAEVSLFLTINFILGAAFPAKQEWVFSPASQRVQYGTASRCNWSNKKQKPNEKHVEVILINRLGNGQF